MSQIKFKQPIVRQVSTMTRHISPTDTVYSIGPFVNMEKGTNAIYITAHFLEHIKRENISVPDFAIINNNKIRIDINIKSDISEESIESNQRSHWEIVLQEDSGSDTRLKDLKEIYVHLDFNEDNLREKMEDIKNVLRDTDRSLEDKIEEITKIAKPEIGDPRRGTRVIPT